MKRSSLDYWLSQVGPKSLPWRRHIALFWNAGATDFLKIPAEIETDYYIWNPHKIAGDARPIACPEPAPHGTRFVLAVFDGVHWSYGDKPLLANPEKTHNEELTRRKEFLEKAIKEIPALDDMFRGMKSRIFESLSYFSIPPLPRVSREYKRGRPIDMDDLEKVFAAGVAYGLRFQLDRESPTEPLSPRADLRKIYHLDPNKYGDCSKLKDFLPSLIETHKKNRDWKEILRYASERHGKNLTPLQMIDKLGGILKEEMINDPKDPLGSKIPTRIITWMDGTTTELDEFQKRHRSWRKENPLRGK